MNCEKCGKPRVALFTSVAPCEHCSSPKYPELAKGRFFWIDSEEHRQLPTGTWWKIGTGGWSASNVHTPVFGRVKHLYALPGPEPETGEVQGVEIPVLDRPPFGAWGDRFYFLGERSRLHQWYEPAHSGYWLTDGVHNVGPFPGQQIIREHKESAEEFGEGRSGHTTQELIDWLEAQR